MGPKLKIMQNSFCILYHLPVRCKDHRPPLFDDAQGTVPKEAAGFGIHSCSWLILQFTQNKCIGFTIIAIAKCLLSCRLNCTRQGLNIHFLNKVLNEISERLDFY